MSSLKFLKSCFLLAIVIGLNACGNGGNNNENTVNTKDTAEAKNDAKFDKVGEKDAQALVDAYAASTFEQRVSDTVKMYSSNADVQSIAGTMADAHSKLNMKIKGLADKKGVSLPADITPEQADKIMKWKEQKDKAERDKGYVSDLVSAHKDAIDLFQKSAQNCTDPDIKALFSDALPELQHHLEMATALHDKMKK
ncbi:DUF4142 domain-containing protein [Ferruginibacter albus]|uniref:DUF4142 domain-containing protein n=1 Tax=Ferruginibacter albus TaxID=2875540 RepID=UPI001CC3BC44|nr:DUF4142 domain-containing protein [Ferruginibacter albus]UAY51087.1 DUF4142 domain-containing protein [Ferruginibacter albus]